jgi:hypothetical protein
MPLNASRCSNRECHISGYTVVGSENGGVVTFVIQDPCNTLTSQRLMKLVFQKAYNMFIAANELTGSSCEGNCECPFGPAGADFYFATKTMTFEPTSTEGLDVTSGDVEYDVSVLYT